MKRLRRKKSSNDIGALNSKTVAGSAGSVSHPTSSETSLYSRFATSHRTRDGSPTKPIVSGPMALSSKTSFTGTGVGTMAGRGVGVGMERGQRQITRIPSKQEEKMQQKVLVSPPSRTSSRAHIVPSSSTSSLNTTQQQRQHVNLTSLPTSPRAQISRMADIEAGLFTPSPSRNETRVVDPGSGQTSARDRSTAQERKVSVTQPVVPHSRTVSPHPHSGGDKVSQYGPINSSSVPSLPFQDKLPSASTNRPTPSTFQYATPLSPPTSPRFTTRRSIDTEDGRPMLPQSAETRSKGVETDLSSRLRSTHRERKISVTRAARSAVKLTSSPSPSMILSQDAPESEAGPSRVHHHHHFDHEPYRVSQYDPYNPSAYPVSPPRFQEIPVLPTPSNSSASSTANSAIVEFSNRGKRSDTGSIETTPRRHVPSSAAPTSSSSTSLATHLVSQPAKSLLTSSPSAGGFARKQYSPLAAFGLPVSQSFSSYSNESTSVSSSMSPTEKTISDKSQSTSVPPNGIDDVSEISSSSRVGTDYHSLPVSLQEHASSSSLERRSSQTDDIHLNTHEPRSSAYLSNAKARTHSSNRDSQQWSSSSSPHTRIRDLEHLVDVTTTVSSETSRHLEPERFLSSSSQVKNPIAETVAQSPSSRPSSSMPDGGRGGPITATSIPSARSQPPQRSHTQRARVSPFPQYPQSHSHPKGLSTSTSRPAVVPAYQNGPVRGRPLIFAAMAVDSEAAEVENEPSSPPKSVSMADIEAQNQAVGTSAAIVYPSPTSPPRLEDEESSIPLSVSVQKKEDRTSPEPHDQVQPPTAQPESDVTRRRRKLSKPHREMPRSVDVAPPPPLPTAVAADMPIVPPQPQNGRKESSPPRLFHHHHHDRPVTPFETTPSPPVPLGSPIQLNHSQSAFNIPEGNLRKPRDHHKLLHRPRDGVKSLTEKQMERLNQRMATVNGNGVNGLASARKAKEVNEQSQVKAQEQEVMEVMETPVIQSAISAAEPTAGPAFGPAPTATPPQPPVQLPTPPTPLSPEEYTHARSRRRGDRLEKSRPAQLDAFIPHHHHEHEHEHERHEHYHESEEQNANFEEMQEDPPEPKYYPLQFHLSDPSLLANLLCYLSYFEWCTLTCVSKEIRSAMYERRDLEELILERYLKTVGYERWNWKQREPLVLSIQDLCSYMHNVSIPSHQYARIAENYLQPNSTMEARIVRDIAASCRAFTRVVLRLRAQAEAEADHNARNSPTPPSQPSSPPSRSPSKHPPRSGPSRSSSRAPSPTSLFSHGHTMVPSQRTTQTQVTFKSPLFRPRRAPLLQVFVPSPEGDWLSDTGVLECEAELKRAGVLHLLRAGDVVWDVAVGDEGNVGRMVWDGSYLIDLDYSYSRVGDLPKYLPTLAFPPSYFHRVIRTMGTGNPIVHVDVSPWADQIATNLQLLQDRTKTETPQGGHHTVVRWVHRSSFTIRPPPGAKSIRIPVPHTAGPGPASTGAWTIDSGWYGMVVVEAEGTNEGLADLQARCKGSFPVRARGADPGYSPERMRREEKRTVFRILRERSRPGEIWLRTVHDKERLVTM